MLKKSISVFLCTVMVLASLSLGAFAYHAENMQETLDLSAYSWDDIMTMRNTEYRELLAKFERVYDPFGTYAANQPLMELNENQISPQWTSGDEKDSGSHELITARACGILLDDMGFWGDNRSASLVAALMISLASVIPDKDYGEGPLSGFEGHFYDPDTNTSYTQDSINTAKTNMVKNYTAAVNAYRSGGVTENFVELVGKMLHYIQDACEPHHAANVTAVVFWKGHSSFESYADKNLNSYIDSYTTLLQSEYKNALSLSKENIIYSAAKNAKGYISMVDNIADKSKWDAAAYATTRNAVRYSVQLLYKLSVEAGIPLVK